MLFRCSTYYSAILLAMAPLSHANENLEFYKNQGKELGRSLQRLELSPEELEAITSKELRNQKFEGETALQQLNNPLFHYRNRIQTRPRNTSHHRKY